MVETGKEGMRGCGCRTVGNFHHLGLAHHERRSRPASDHPEDKEEEERRARRRSRFLRLQEKEEGS